MAFDDTPLLPWVARPLGVVSREGLEIGRVGARLLLDLLRRRRAAHGGRADDVPLPRAAGAGAVTALAPPRPRIGLLVPRFTAFDAALGPERVARLRARGPAFVAELERTADVVFPGIVESPDDAGRAHDAFAAEAAGRDRRRARDGRAARPRRRRAAAIARRPS